MKDELKKGDLVRFKPMNNLMIRAVGDSDALITWKDENGTPCVHRFPLDMIEKDGS